jgi:hypothetical protein
MRDVLLGALGAVFLYPLVWYGSAPTPVEVVSDPNAGTRPVAEATPTNGGSPLSGLSAGRAGTPRAEGGGVRGAVVSRRVEPVPGSAPSASAAETLLPREPTLPRVARPSQPSEPSAAALPPGLPELLSRVSDVQQNAADPTELAKRVETLDMDSTQLAQLKAFADQFVKLPPSAAERYVSSEHSGAPAARPSPRH